MKNLRNVISLHEASRISGYNQDYLSSLIRKNEIKGEKKGGTWFTVEEEVTNYIFKKKIKNKNWAIRYFLSFLRANSSFIYAFIFLAILSAGLYLYNQQFGEIQTQTQIQKVNPQPEEFKQITF